MRFEALIASFVSFSRGLVSSALISRKVGQKLRKRVVLVVLVLLRTPPVRTAATTARRRPFVAFFGKFIDIFEIRVM